MASSKGGRPPTGRPKWSKSKGMWRAWVKDPNTGEFVPVDMPGISETDETRARTLAKVIARKAINIGAVPEHTAETVNEWFDRWLEDREARGIATVGHDKSRLRRHVRDVIGTVPIADVTRDDIERVVEDLDRKILLPVGHADHLEWKTAGNVWSLITKAFDDAANAKTRALRARPDNPAKGVKGPERGVQKAKQYLYPSEFLRVMNADDAKVPLRFRTLYAVAIYTFARAGELEALTWRDVDLEHGVVSITKAVDRKTGKVKSTKSGETRRVPIEPNLYPLFQRLHAARANDDARVLWLPDDEDRAVMLREHLLLAGVKRAELFLSDSERKNITFHDLRATGITWMAVRGDDPLRIKQRAGHRGFATTEGYIREAENLAVGFGDPFPILPVDLTGGFGMGFGVSATATGPTTRNHSGQEWSKGGSNTTTERREVSPESPPSTEKDAEVTSEQVASVATVSNTSGPSEEEPDAVEGALAAALRGATEAGRWDLVAQLAGELQARRAARAGGNVVALSSRKRRAR